MACIQAAMEQVNHFMDMCRWNEKQDLLYESNGVKSLNWNIAGTK